MYYDFSVECVRKLRIQCDAIGIKTTPDFWTASILNLTQVFNSVEPAVWCPKFNRLVKYLLEPFLMAALQHDWEMSRPYKSWGIFTSMNLRFVYNAFQEAMNRKMPSLIFMGMLLALLCQIFGYKTYLKTSIPEEK